MHWILRVLAARQVLKRINKHLLSDKVGSFI